MTPHQQNLLQGSAAPPFDALIIGGGPAGLSAALILGRACRRVALIDADQPRNAAARELHGFLTRDGVPPRELLWLGREEVTRYGVELIDDHAVNCSPESANPSFKTLFAVTCSSGRKLFGRKLLFASGTCDMLPDLPGVKECYGATVHHCPYCDGWEHRGRHLVAYGEEATKAIELGLFLRGWSPHVTLVMNGKAASASDKTRLDRNGIGLCEKRIARLIHAGDQLQGLQFQDGERIEAHALFFSAQQRANCDLPRGLGCHVDEDRLARTSHKQKTNVTGVYLAGDADGDVQFAIVAAAEGATAAAAINREILDEDIR